MAANKLNNLTERELLLLLNEKVDRLEQEVSSQKALADKVAQLEMKLLEQQIKIRVWGAVIGFVAGIVGSILPKLLHL
ncbi:MAG: hypothetical protein JNM22_01880 [Saprospiraceae bacterium]|nr:hypothetical protein [Saprospiraceae bacterium]